MDKLCECECPQAPVGVYNSFKVLDRHRMTNVMLYSIWGLKEHGLEGRLHLLWTGLGMRGDEKEEGELGDWIDKTTYIETSQCILLFWTLNDYYSWNNIIGMMSLTIHVSFVEIASICAGA